MANEAQQLQGMLGVTSTIELDFPVTLADGKILAKLETRRLRVGDLRAVAGITTEAEQELALFSRATGLIAEDLDLLDIADYQKLQEWFRLSQKSKQPS